MLIWSTKYRFAAFSLILLLLLGACNSGEEKSSKQAETQKTFKVGLIIPHAVVTQIFDAYIVEMETLGYIEGQNITYLKEGPPENQLEILGMPQKLVDEDVDLLVVISTEIGLLAQSATQNIPIVFIAGDKPAEVGLVDSLDKPGGNITGVMVTDPDARRMQILLEIDPSIKTLYVPYNPNDFQARAGFEETVAAAEEFGVTLIKQEITDVSQIPQALQEFPEDVDGIFMLSDITVTTEIETFTNFANARKIPLTSPGATNNSNMFQSPNSNRPLMGYGLFVPDLAQKSARLSDQILQGAKPGDLPVETAEFYLMINLDTAKVIGVNIPDHILNQAQIIIRDSQLIEQAPR